MTSNDEYVLQLLREKGYDAAILNGNAKALLEALSGSAACAAKVIKDER